MDAAGDAAHLPIEGVRADRFSYGRLLYVFESGAFTAILRLQQLFDAHWGR